MHCVKFCDTQFNYFDYIGQNYCMYSILGYNSLKVTVFVFVYLGGKKIFKALWISSSSCSRVDKLSTARREAP